MGVLNVTPDSFSDGGLYLDLGAAMAHAEKMVKEGADLIDVGGESTRPGSTPVSIEEELKRVVPVVRALVIEGCPVSIDTSKPEVASRCVEAGACVVNDVTSLRNPAMVAVCAEAGCTVCLMHMQGEPNTMQRDPTYGDVVTEVRDALLRSADLAIAAGVRYEDVWIDPGIGFGKTVQHNLQLINHVDVLVTTGHPVMVGVSRKSFIGKVLGTDEDPAPIEQRLDGAIAAQVIAQLKGARIVRTHDVASAARAARLAAAVTRSD
jgi:dihydropteroate synthase